MRTLKPALTEDQFVAAIAEAVSRPPRTLVVGIGDDAAVWKVPRAHYCVITTDMLVDGVHFRHALTTPQALGHKALAVNLSDIAAMGAAPVLAVVALGITGVVDEVWARTFYAGMAKLAKTYRCAVAGGDIARAPALTIAPAVVGEVRKSGLRLRTGAKAGDVACVTGPLGLAAAGLYCSNGPLGPLTGESASVLHAAYETPTPRVLEGKFLGASRATHAMMDISDGLSLDASRMARASNVDICFDLTPLAPHPALAEFLNAQRNDTSLKAPGSNGSFGPSTAMDLMLHGGDDYELLAAVEPRAFPHLARRFKARFGRDLIPVGRFEPGEGRAWVLVNGRRREHIPRGYDHLAARP